MTMDFAVLNEACLDVFGQACTFTRADTREELVVTGILEEGVELEGAAPGDGSIYAQLWLPASDINPAPEPGDEISTASTIYKILRIEQDAGGGMRILLRKDRDVA